MSEDDGDPYIRLPEGQEIVGLKAQLRGIRNAARGTDAAAIRELQERLEALTTVVARLDVTSSRLEADSLANHAAIEHVEHLLDAMKGQLRTVTDDLGDRIGAIAARVDATTRP